MAESMAEPIVLKNLCKTYSMPGEEIHAVRDITLTIPDREFLAMKTLGQMLTGNSSQSWGAAAAANLRCCRSSALCWRPPPEAICYVGRRLLV